MKAGFLTAVIALFLITACSVEPTPIVIGEDACSHCKMTMMDQRFGAELITSKGKIYKFDDINCMVLFMKEEMKDQEVDRLYVVDFSLKEPFIEAGQATFVRNIELRTPMASHVAAFDSEAATGPFMEEYPGTQVVSWTDISEEFD